MSQAYTSLLTDVDSGPVNRRGDALDLDPDTTATTATTAPTASYALATATHENGAAPLAAPICPPGPTNIPPGSQTSEEAAPTTDLGWHSTPESIPDPLVAGISNEELWTLVRRFDKQIQHVRVTHNYVKGDLDLSVAPDEAFSPDRLRGNVERLYMTVIIGLMAFAKHIARIRSWEDKQRTATFCFVYFLSWALDLLLPLTFGTLLLLTVYPPARTTLFPPLSLATTDALSGGTKAPPSGLRESQSNSMTGAPEAQTGEAVEQEARHFVSGFGAIAISSAAGKSESGVDDDDSAGGKDVPDPIDAAVKVADVKGGVEGGDGDGLAKKATKKVVEEAVWEGARGVMSVVGGLADTWERFANALSPTPPFPRKTNYQLAAALLPLFLFSFIITPYILIKSTTFLLGIAFYSQPYITQGLTYLNKSYPHWKEALSLQNTILNSVPTNAQLTLTLLRLGEAHNAPLPPPTTSPHKLTLAQAQQHAQAEATPSSSSDGAQTYSPDHPSQPQPKAKSLSLLKQTVKATVRTALHTDHLKAHLSHSLPSKNRLGAVTNTEDLSCAPTGPKKFAARWMGIKGDAVIFNSSTLECSGGDGGSGAVLQWNSEDGKKEWRIPVEDVVEVEKLGGLGWKGKAVVGWSLEEKKVVDAVRVRYIVRGSGREEVGNGEMVGERSMREEEKMLTAVVGREELVNRLLAMGRQRWECC